MAAPAVCHADEAAVLRARVVSHDQVADATWRIRLDCPSIAARAVPGQFAMLRLPDRCDPLLARPFAVYDTFSDGIEPRYADFIYLVHGRFTRALADVRPGDEILSWGPLGNGFAAPAASARRRCWHSPANGSVWHGMACRLATGRGQAA
jgi:dihydroorotate dehydrogenase electron transfer subunit